VSADGWQDALDEAERPLREALAGVAAEAGPGADPAVVRAAFARRVRSRRRLRAALARGVASEARGAYGIANGYEPVPGAPGTLRRRPGGPLPRAAQERLARALDLPLHLLDEAAEGGGPGGRHRSPPGRA